MILKRKSEEEKFAEELARELEAQAKEALSKLSPEAKRRLQLLEKNSEAWKSVEKRIERGEIKLYWRKVGDELYIAARETFHGFPFKRHGDYILLPSGLDEYIHQFPPMDIDWIQANAETWKPRPLATIKWLNEPVVVTSYDGWDETAYMCIVEARDGRRFLATELECMILEETDGRKTAYDVARRTAARYFDNLWHYRLKRELAEGKVSREDVKKVLDEMPQNAYLGLVVLKALGLLV